jgi:hypothetical protein
MPDRGYVYDATFGWQEGQGDPALEQTKEDPDERMRQFQRIQEEGRVLAELDTSLAQLAAARQRQASLGTEGVRPILWVLAYLALVRCQFHLP